jgi:hypothetical protein
LLRLFSLSHSKSKPILTHTPAHPAFYGISIRWPFQLGCRNWDKAPAGTVPLLSREVGQAPAETPEPVPSQRERAGPLARTGPACPILCYSDLQPESLQPVFLALPP